MGVYALTAMEIYDAYSHGRSPADLVNVDRARIATRLMLEENMDENAAYYATDELLAYA